MLAVVLGLESLSLFLLAIVRKCCQFLKKFLTFTNLQYLVVLLRLKIACTVTYKTSTVQKITYMNEFSMNELLCINDCHHNCYSRFKVH